MKLFAPRNDWSMTSSSSWWPLMGSVPTTSGVMISKENALGLSPVFAATRVISETLASLPLNTFEVVDARTTRKAMSHPLYSLLHDEPNPEQDIMSWLDMQVAFQINWGNAYAEVQRNGIGEIVALWPIHPSRIPLTNIRRNGSNPFKIQAGQPGELVYWVNNDDGTATPIPAVDMLHVPGVMSSNGITGKSIIEIGANSLGIAMATDEHAGSFFRNGAVANVALKTTAKLGKEAADRLREQWQRVFGGSKNHYKTIILEEGMEPFPFSISPENSQLLNSRQFSVTEVARWYRLPPHMLADLSRSNFSNIEAENLSFVVHSMIPWITRWEKALRRQLLKGAEKSKYILKFNVNGLLRGDSAARASFYQAMFNLGAFSPNDIRGYEDLNPVEGGDQYFVQGNNSVPLTKIGEQAQANIAKTEAETERIANPPAPALVQAPNPDQTATNQRLIELRKLQEDLIHKVELRDAKDDLKLAAIELFKQQHEADRAAGVVREEYHQQTVEQVLNAVEEVAKRQVETDLTPILEAIHSVPAQTAALVPEKTQVVEIPIPDTQQAESLAVREAQMQAEAAALSARLESERATTDRVLALSLKRDIDKLAEWEAKTLEKAVEKPAEWVEWRGKFYQRWRKYFAANLGEYVEHAQLCGVTLELEWGADRYADQSIADLKTLDASAADNHHDRLKECVSHFCKRQWAERSAVLAAEMISRGRQQYHERQKGSHA